MCQQAGPQYALICAALHLIPNLAIRVRRGFCSLAILDTSLDLPMKRLCILAWPGAKPCRLCACIRSHPICYVGAMKLVADCFPWSRQSMFAYAHDNHNSIVGMREVAMAAGASALCVVLSAGEHSAIQCLYLTSR